MKNFFKKVAFVLALAMVLSNIGPAAKVSAAETPGLKYSSKVLYVGGSAWDDYTDSCWTPSQNHDGYTVSYEWDSDIIDVASNGRITATGNRIGKAVVTVIYTPMGSGKVETAKFTVKVRRNATDVRLTNATFDEINKTLSIGDEIVLNAAKSFVGNSYKKGNYGLNNYMKVVSDQIAYVSSDDEVIKVEGNMLTAVGNGTATLTVFAYEYGDKDKIPVRYKDYTITVVGGLLSVEQKATNKLEVVLGNAEDVKMSDFTITRVSSKLNIAVKDISVEENVVTITTFAEMKDNAEYAVEYDGKEIVFTATDGKVADITINRTTIPYNVETEISANLLDAKGVILATVKKEQTSNNGYTVDFSIETVEGYVIANNLLLFNKDNTAKVTVTYRTGDYDSTTGEEIGTVEKVFTIVGIDPIAADPGVLQYLISKDGTPNWDNMTSSANICVSETLNLYAYRKDSNNADTTKAGGYYFESSNLNILIVTNVSTNDKGIKASVTAITTGTAYVLVKNNNGTVIDTIPVTIKPKREYSSFILNTYSATLTDSAKINEPAVIKLTFNDQYGDEMSNQDDIVYDIVQTSGPANTISDKFGSTTGRNITFTALHGISGTYTYRITKGNVSRTVVITVQHADEPNANGSNVSYRIISSGSRFDSAYNAGWADTWDNIAEVKVGVYTNGVLYEYYEDAVINWVKKGSDIVTSMPYVETISGAAIVSVRTVSGGAYAAGEVTKAPSGSYTVSITVDRAKYNDKAPGDLLTLTSGFVVTDSQKSMVAMQKETYTNTADGNNNFDKMIKNTFDFYYDGGKANQDNITILKVYTANNLDDLTEGSYGVGQVPITKVDLTYVIDSKVVTFYGVAIGKTITINP